MMNIERVRSENRETITVGGDLTVHHAKSLKTALLEAVQSATSVVLAIDQVRELDVSFPQLVCAAHRSAASLNKELIMTGLEHERLARMLRHSGFIRHIGCHESTRKTCLWLRSEEES